MTLLDKHAKTTLKQWIPDGKKRGFNLLYKATRDGLSPTVFHQKCDGKGATITLAQNTASYVFGGYTQMSWNSAEDFITDNTAFLFCLKQNNANATSKWHTQNQANAIAGCASYGPLFGGGNDLNLFTGTPTRSGNHWTASGSANCGTTYPTDANSLCGNDLKLTEVEVYQITDEVDGGINDEPWRVVDGWADKIRAQLIQDITKYKPHEALGIQQSRILLLGPVGAGKSSFFNTISSVFRGRVTSQAGSGSAQHSVTTYFRTYQLRSRQGGNALNIRLCDTMGLEEDQGLNAGDVGYILDGHIQDSFQFNPAARISATTPGFVKETSLATSIHCVAVIIDASSIDVLGQKMVEKLTAIKDVAQERGKPVIIVLTKVDRVCEETCRDVKNVFHSQAVLGAVDEIASKLGLPKKQVVPVKNYEQETEVVLEVDVLALLALRQILRCADDYFDDRLDLLDTGIEQARGQAKATR